MPRSWKKYDKVKEECLIKYTTENITLSDLSKEYKIGRNVISNFLKNNGIQIKQYNFKNRPLIFNEPGYNHPAGLTRKRRNPFDYFTNNYLINEITKCWEWQKGTNKRGYGQFWIADLKRMKGSHVFSYEHYKGEINANLLVCHTCDNPKCVNPDHLFLGTHQDNTNDMIAKGRATKRAKKKEKK